jgi:hypothetical protein
MWFVYAYFANLFLFMFGLVKKEAREARNNDQSGGRIRYKRNRNIGRNSNALG